MAAARPRIDAARPKLTSVLTQEVKAMAAARPRIDAARPKLTSGQLPFPG